MSKNRLTLRKGGLASIDVSSGDVPNGTIADIAEARAYLYDISGIKILILRSLEVIKSIGLTVADAPLTLTTLSNGTAGAPNPNAAHFSRPEWAIQNRIHKMSKIISDLAVSFFGNYTDLKAIGYTESQSIRRATEEFIQGMKAQFDIFNVTNPDAFTMSAIEARVVSEQSAKELLEYLSYNGDMK